MSSMRLQELADLPKPTVRERHRRDKDPELLDSPVLFWLLGLSALLPTPTYPGVAALSSGICAGLGECAAGTALVKERNE